MNILIAVQIPPLITGKHHLKEFFILLMKMFKSASLVGMLRLKYFQTIWV